MTSHRPYLLRALYEWIADNGMTPHLLVDATRQGVQVPMHAVKDGKIVLNIAERAEAVGRDACKAAGVQWLDQSVHAIGIRPYRRDSGWLGWERTFRFDYSIDGQDRHIGRMVLRGETLIAFSGPVTREPTSLH